MPKATGNDAGKDKKPMDTHYLYSQQRIEELFSQLDTNKDGTIDVKDLSEAVAGQQSKNFLRQNLLKRSNSDDGITLDEFTSFVTERQKDLRISFDHIDTDQNGEILPSEVINVFQRCGIRISENEAATLVERLDSNRTNSITWDEWREYFLLHPASQSASALDSDEDPVGAMLHHWRQCTIDFGETNVPDDFTQKEIVSGGMLRSLLAGAVAGSVSRTATAPLDRLKIFMQVYAGGQRGVVNSARSLYKEGGVKGFWRGNFINVVKIAPETSVKFATYEAMKKMMRNEYANGQPLSHLQRFLCGSTAGVVSQTFVYPMEVVKTRMALGRTGEYKGIMSCAVDIYRREGLASFGRGYLPNVAGVIPYAGIDLAVYETLKMHYIKWVLKPGEGQDPGVLGLLACGATSSVCGQLVSYPLALIRTRLQAKASLGGDRDTVRGLVRSIIETDGLRGLYRGLVPNFMKVVPAVSCSYLVYEKTSKFLADKMS